MGGIGGGPSRCPPLAPLTPRLCLAGTWRSALWPSWPPLGPRCPPTPPVTCRTSPPGPGCPPPRAPRDSLRGRGAAAGPGGVTQRLPLVPRWRGTNWDPPRTRCTCRGCRRPTPDEGRPPRTSPPQPTTPPTAPSSSARCGVPAVPHGHLGLCRAAGATLCPGRPPRPSTGGPVGRRCHQRGPEPPGIARRCPGRPPVGKGHRATGGDGGGGRGDTSSSTPPAWWCGPSTCHPRSDSRSATLGGPRCPLPAAPRCPRGSAAPPPLPLLPGSPRAAPGARGGAREGAGVPGGGGRCSTPRPCVRPCPASAATPPPTPTRTPRGAWGAPGSGSAETPEPTAAAAAAWKAPGQRRAPPAPPLLEGRGLKGCGAQGEGLRGVWRSGAGLGGWAPGWGSGLEFPRALFPNKGSGIAECCPVSPCLCHPLGSLRGPQRGRGCPGTPPRHSRCPDPPAPSPGVTRRSRASRRPPQRVTTPVGTCQLPPSPPE